MDTHLKQHFRSHTPFWIAGPILVMLIGIVLVTIAFSRYTSDQLYQESRAQLNEITEQSYEKLGVVLDAQWRYTKALEALFMERAPASVEELARSMHGARLRLSPLDDSYRFVMLGNDNHFYTESGERRLWTDAAALDLAQHRQSMLVSLAEDEGNYMAFAHRLEQPITLLTDNGDVVLTHIILMKQLESLTGYFRCSAFNNQNVTFVLQNNGVKMYSDFAEDVLSQSYNVFDTLRKFSFPHSGSLDACLEQLDKTGAVCTDVVYKGGSYFLCLKGMRFLCAEDNELNAEILQALLELAGASCTICANGQEIVDAFEEVKPGDYDAILMDVQMPVMNGYEATRRIRASANPVGQTIPILAMTANAFSDDIQQSIAAGMDAHISKPVDMKVLEATVRSFCVTPPPNP